MRTKKNLFFVLTVLTGIGILFPQLNFQPYLSQGDHGRDLYAFERSWQGDQPYIDYWWVYGPLMPHYYGMLFKLLGVTMKTVLFGQSLLTFTSGIFFYLSLSLFFPRIISWIGAIWFWVFKSEFFFTYNHAGGTALLSILMYLIFLYIKNPRMNFLWGGLLCALAISFIKINIGLFSLLAFLLSVFLIDWLCKNEHLKEKKYFYLIGFFVLPAFILTSSFLLLKDLPLYAIRQCMPYLSVDHPYNISLNGAVKLYWSYFRMHFVPTWTNFVFGTLIILGTAQTIYATWKDRKNNDYAQQILSVLCVLVLFIILLLHEFLASGVHYTTFWPKSFQFLFIFTVLAFASKDLHRILRFLLFTLVVFIAVTRFIEYHQDVKMFKAPQYYLSLDRGKIYIGNEPQWIDTVQKATYFLKEHLAGDETFLALPYDPLYYYLTARRSPTRQIIFFEHINIPPEQEIAVISELEKNHVNYVVLSSRAFCLTERGLGLFGKTYCPTLGTYVQQNFELIATFGEWEKYPGWNWNHGVKIFRRIPR